MKIYIDGLLFLNFSFDFLLLLTTNIILKRNKKITNIILGAFIGSLSVLLLFLKINSIQLFLIKIYLSIIMCLITFNHKGLKSTLHNIVTFYLTSILLGGFLYLLNIEFSYKNNGIIFYNNNLSINILILFILSPIILYIYIWQNKYIKQKIKNHYKVELKTGKKVLNLVGYLDTGNTLEYQNKPVIITNKKIKSNKKKILVPYKTIGNTGILECLAVEIYVHNLGNFSVLLGYHENLNISGVDVLLNNKMEEKNDRKNKKNNKNIFGKRRNLFYWKCR